MPVTLDDPVLGRLTWDGRLDWWVGSAQITPGSSVDILISCELSDDKPEFTEEAVIAASRRGLLRIREREPEYRRRSAEQYQKTRWNTEETMSVEDIAGLLKAASLTFRADGSSRIYWDDQDRLFWGNNVVTDLNADGEWVDAGME